MFTTKRNYWETSGTTSLIGETVLDSNNKSLIFDYGSVFETGATSIIRASVGGTDDVTHLGFKHNSARTLSDGFTDIKVGTNSGNPTSPAGGNITIGQNVLSSLVTSGSFLASPWYSTFRGDRNVAIGFDIATGWTGMTGGNQGTSNILMGVRAAKNTKPIGFSIVMGWETANNITAEPAHWESMIAIGTYAMTQSTINSSASPSHSNIMAIGSYAGYQATFIDGFSTTLLGESAGYGATLLEDYEILIGGAGQGASLGRGNIGIGERALWGAKGGSAGSTGVGTNQFNVAVGVHAMEGSGPSEKGAYVGCEAGQGVVIGQKNSGFGSWSLPKIQGHHNTGIGAYGGYMTSTITGNGNTFIGPSTGVALSTLNVNNVMVMGNPYGTSSTSGYRPVAQSNTVYIGSVGDIIFTQNYDGTPKTVTFNPSGLTYGSNYSSGFTKHSIVDVNYVTGTTSTSISGATNALTKSGKTVELGGALTKNTSITGSDYSITLQPGIFNLNASTNASRQVSISTTNVGSFLMQFSTLRFEIIDHRTTKKGIEYNADYSAGFTSRSLIDKGFASNNFWKVTGTTVLTNSAQINNNGANNLIFQGDGTTGNNIRISNTDGLFEEGRVNVSFNKVELSYGFNPGTPDNLFVIDTSGATFTSTSSKTMKYANNYSSNFTKHSIVDVNYVTGITSTLGDNTLAGNGLTKTGDVIKLGGVITGNSTIENSVNSIVLNSSDYPGEIYWSAFDGTDKRGYIFNYGTRIELFVNKNDTLFGYGLASVLIGYDTIDFGQSKKVTFNGNTGLLDYNSSINTNTGVTDNTLISYGFGKNNFITKNISNNLANTSDTQTVLTTGNIGVGSTNITFKNDSGDPLATSITIQDSQKRGLLYGGNYSTGFTKHSLVDVNYVTGITSTISANVANGLSKDAGTIVLGGALTTDTTITSTGSTHDTTISLSNSAFGAALNVTTEYNDGFTMGATTLDVKHFNGTVLSFDDLNGEFNQFKVGASGIEATSNGNSFGKYAYFDVSNSNQYGKPDEQPQVFQQIVEQDGTTNDVLFSQYGFDVTMRNAGGDDLARFTITKTGTTFTDGRTVKRGIQYTNNYSSGFTKHSIVDVNYVTGITSQIQITPTVTSANIVGNVVVDLSTADIFLLTLTGNVTTFNYTGETIGKQYIFKFIQDTTNKTLSWATGRYRFPFGNSPALTNPTTNGSSPAHSEDIITAICMSSGRLDIAHTPDLREN